MTFPTASSKRRKRRVHAWPLVLSIGLAFGGSSLLGNGVMGCGSSLAGSGDAGRDGGKDALLEDTVDAVGGFDVGPVDDARDDAGFGTDATIADASCTLEGCPGQCLLGRCVFSIYSNGFNGAAGLAVQSGTVYWTVPGATPGAGYVWSLPTLPPTSGGSPSPHIWAENQENPAGVAVNATSLYWANDSPTAGSVVGELLASGGLPDAGAPDGGMRDASVMLETLGTGQASPSGVAIDDSYVYWTVTGATTSMNDAGLRATGYVIKAPLAGGRPTTLASQRAAPAAIAVDDTYVYWVDSGLAGPLGGALYGAVLKVNKATGGTPVTLQPSQLSPRGIAVGGGNVYYGSVGVRTMSRLLSTPADVPDGSTPVPPAVVWTGPTPVGGIAADSTTVYWTVVGGHGSGSVMSVPINGSILRTLADGLDSPGAITVDEQAAYWVDSVSGTVTSATPK